MRLIFRSGIRFASRAGATLKWTDGEEIAELLIKKHGKTLNPLSLRFTKLHEMVTSLPEFADDPEKSNEKKLENIQMQWFELYSEE